MTRHGVGAGCAKLCHAGCTKRARDVPMRLERPMCHHGYARGAFSPAEGATPCMVGHPYLAIKDANSVLPRYHCWEGSLHKGANHVCRLAPRLLLYPKVLALPGDQGPTPSPGDGLSLNDKKDTPGRWGVLPPRQSAVSAGCPAKPWPAKPSPATPRHAMEGTWSPRCGRRRA
jgi:hypothetical protein